MDVDAFRMEIPLRAIVGPIAGRRKKGATTDPFLAGPVPMWWLERAYRLGAAALAVGLALWHAKRMRGGSRGQSKSTQPLGGQWACRTIRPGAESTRSTATVW